eukprot:359409-Chlamydomonas_euryale.AAC.1
MRRLLAWPSVISCCSCGRTTAAFASVDAAQPLKGVARLCMTVHHARLLVLPPAQSGCCGAAVNAFHMRQRA